MSSFTLVMLCVGVLAAVILSYLVPTLHYPSSHSSSVSSSALFEAAYLGDLLGVRRLLALHANHSLQQHQHQHQSSHGQQLLSPLPRDSHNNTALHVSTLNHLLVLTRSSTHSISSEPFFSLCLTWCSLSLHVVLLCAVSGQ